MCGRLRAGGMNVGCFTNSFVQVKRRLCGRSGPFPGSSSPSIIILLRLVRSTSRRRCVGVLLGRQCGAPDTLEALGCHRPAASCIRLGTATYTPGAFSVCTVKTARGSTVFESCYRIGRSSRFAGRKNRLVGNVANSRPYSDVHDLQ
jgi:hypothetical protein